METNYNLEDLVRYRPAVVALNSYKEGNDTAAKSVLEKLANTLDLGKDGPAAIKAIRQGKEGGKILANIYAPEYQNILFNSKVKDLFEFYSNKCGIDYFKEYIEGDSYEEATRVFEEYGNEDYRDMLAKVIEANEKLESKSPNLTDEDKKKAEETIAKYGRITNPIQSFEGLEIKNLSDPAENNALKKNLTEMFKPAKKSE